MILWCFVLTCALTACNLSDDAELTPTKKPDVTGDDTGTDTGADSKLPGDDVDNWQPDAACKDLNTGARCEAPLGADGVAAGWGNCGAADNGENACASEGVERRMMQVGTCSAAGQCEFSGTEESDTITRSCERGDTDGVACGEIVESDVTACENAGICETTGRQNVTITSGTCAAGACKFATETVPRACTRVTEGLTCGDTIWTRPGLCRRADETSCSYAGKRGHFVVTYTCNDSGTCQDHEELVEEDCTIEDAGNNGQECASTVHDEAVCFQTCCVKKCVDALCPRPTCNAA
ncbi:MAG: hypothetical protein H0U74_16900 [Bradymonadaceae bacterium]|nr:hypothetical protein [Lujinxingiaceae bacterium]